MTKENHHFRSVAAIIIAAIVAFAWVKRKSIESETTKEVIRAQMRTMIPGGGQL